MNNRANILEKPQNNTASWVLLISLILIASTMRAPITAVGSLISELRESLQLSNTTAGLLTTLPLLAFAILSPVVPTLAKRVGVTSILTISAFVLTFGIVLRSTGTISTLMIGTIIIGLAIAVCNVLLPSLVKQSFPLHIGLITGIYAVSMNLAGAIASGISVPLAVEFDMGWQGALIVWAGLSFIAALCWSGQLMKQKNKARQTISTATIHQTTPLQKKKPLWKNKTAIAIMLFMGLQSTVFYVLVSWLPEILQSRGMGAEQGGIQLSIIQLSQLPFTLIVPIIAGKMKSQRSLVIIMFVLLLSGVLGLMYAPTSFITITSILLGIGSAFAFSLAMMFFTLRTRDAQQAAALSGMAQSVGYALAAIGPVLFGKLYDMTNDWTIPLFILVGIAVILVITGSVSARQQYVD